MGLKLSILVSCDLAQRSLMDTSVRVTVGTEPCCPTPWLMRLGPNPMTKLSTGRPP